MIFQLHECHPFGEGQHWKPSYLHGIYRTRNLGSPVLQKVVGNRRRHTVTKVQPGLAAPGIGFAFLCYLPLQQLKQLQRSVTLVILTINTSAKQCTRFRQEGSASWSFQNNIFCIIYIMWRQKSKFEKWVWSSHPRGVYPHFQSFWCVS